MAFFAYFSTLAPTIATNDAGRFQIAAPLLGTGHPTGYPTFILIGKLFTFFPVGDLAYRMNLMAAVFGGIAVALMYLVARSVGASRIPATGASLIFAFCATFWDQATFAEVYSMHLAFLLAVTYFLIRWRERGGVLRLVLAALLFGVSLGNNAGMVLLGPAFFILLVAGRWRNLGFSTVVLGGISFLVGISVYAYVPIRGFAGAWNNYGDPVNDWNDAWRLVSGARFQELMGTAPEELLSSAGHFLGEITSQTVAPFGYVLGIGILIGGIYGASRVVARSGAVGVALVVAFLCTFVYALAYDIDDISVYYLPVYAVLSIFLAVGVTELAGIFRFSWIPAVPVVLAALVFGLNFADSDKSAYFDERENSEATLAALPEDAVLYGKVPIIPVTYLREVEGERTDVTLRWLDGGTLERDFESDVESGRPVFFIADERANAEYLPQAEELADAEVEETGMIRFSPKSNE